MSGVALVGGYAADLAFGDPRRGHPVAGFGLVAQRLEAAMYAPSRARGVVFAGGLVGGAALAAAAAARIAGRAGAGRAAVLTVATWACVGGRSLTETADALAADLDRDDVAAARAGLPSLCGRDPSALDTDGLARAALESVAENTSDAVVGALLWGAALGPAGVVAYRAANTLDAMVGYRNPRYRDFGWAAARLDDGLNWPAARLTAALTVICAPIVGGSPATAWATVRRDGAAHPSPNAGRAEAAFAGALGVRLGGPLVYDGVAEMRPSLGQGRAPSAADVHRATRLSRTVGLAAALTCAALRHAANRRGTA